MDIRPGQIIVLISAIFIFAIGFGIVIPILPYYVRDVGATAFDLGLLLATFSFLQFFCGPFWGKISDNIGRKPVLIVGLLGVSIAFLMLGLSHDLFWIFIAEIVGGAMSAGIWPAALAFIADVTRPSERVRLMGLMGAASGVGFIAGPFISSIIAGFGLSVPFFVAAVLSLVTMVAGYLFIPESIGSERRLKVKDLLLPLVIARMVNDTVRQMFGALKTYVGVFLLATLVISLAIAGFEGTFSYYIMDKFGLTSASSTLQVFDGHLSLTGPSIMGIVFALMGVVSVICQGLLVGKASEHLGEDVIIVVGLLICAAGLVLMTTAGDLISLIAYICVTSIGSGLVFPCLNTVVSRRTDENHQGIMLGIMGSYGSFGRIIGPPVAGYTYGMMMILPYYISAIVMFLCSTAIIAIIWKERKNVKGEPPAPELLTKV
jgi:DHA1 family multidrug resistance protein-like MFS transporter